MSLIRGRVLFAAARLALFYGALVALEMGYPRRLLGLARDRAALLVLAAPLYELIRHVELPFATPLDHRSGRRSVTVVGAFPTWTVARVDADGGPRVLACAFHHRAARWSVWPSSATVSCPRSRGVLRLDLGLGSALCDRVCHTTRAARNSDTGRCERLGRVWPNEPLV